MQTQQTPNAVAPRQALQRPPDPVKALTAELNSDAIRAQLTRALPAHVPPDKFIRVLMTAVSKNPDLATADRPSLYNSCVECAADGLMPNGKEAALVIFNTKVKKDGKDVWVKKVQYMPMIRGLYKLARNSGEIGTVAAHVVYERDTFEFSYGFDLHLRHIPHLSEDRGRPVAVYAAATLKDGERDLEVMSVQEVERVRAVSRSKGAGPWTQWWDEMARKTVARRLLKRLPVSEDVERAIDRDNAFYNVEQQRQQAPALAAPPAANNGHDAPQIEHQPMALDPAGQVMTDAPERDPVPAHDPDTGDVVEGDGQPTDGDVQQGGISFGD